MDSWVETLLWTVIIWIFIGGLMHATYTLGHSDGSEGKTLKTWLYSVAAIAIFTLMALFGGGYSDDGEDSPEISANMWLKVLGAMVALVLSYTVGYLDGRKILKAWKKAMK